VRTLIQTLRRSQDKDLSNALIREADSQAHCYAASDLLKGIEAIKNKKDIKF